MVRAERSNYFDAGISQIVIPGLTVGVDGYYKQSTNLIDEGQFGAPIILTAFNYAEGQQSGVELTANYDRGPLSIYANLSYLAPSEKISTRRSLTFNLTNWPISPPTSSTWITTKNGADRLASAYVFNQDSPWPTRVSVDLLVQSGLRASTATVPNGVALPTYATANMSVVQRVGPGTELRLDILNVADATYQIRDGTGVGVGAPQYGLRRTILAGVTQRF